MKAPFVLSTAIAVLCLTHSAHAGNLYWDTNGPTAGSANNAGIWGTDSFWSTDAAGGVATGAYVEDSDVFFSAGTNATGQNTISVSGTPKVRSITFQEGAVTIGTVGSGGLILGAGGVTLNNGLHGNVVLSTNLKSNIVLTANQTWANNTAGNGTTRTLTANAVILGNAPAGETIALTFTTGSGLISVGDANNGGIQDGSGGGKVAVIKEGAGSVTLGGANSYSGGTIINGGTLTFGTAAGRVPQTGTITINSGTLSTTGPTGLNTAGAWLTSGKIATSSAGAIGISSADSSTVDFTNYPNLSLGATANATFSGTIVPGANGYRVGGGVGTLTISSTLDGALPVTVAGSTVALSGANTYSGSTAVNAGTLVVKHASGLGSTASGTTVANLASLAVGNGITVANEPLTISGPGSSNNGALTTDVASSGTWIGNVTLGDANARVGARADSTLTLEGAILGGIGQTFRISGELGTGAVLLKSTGSTFTGETRFIRGKLLLGADDALPIGTVVDMHETSATSDSATLDLNGFNQTIAGLRRESTNALTTVTNSALGSVKTLTINQSANREYGSGAQPGLITGNLAIVKSGLGTLTLGADNSYTGGTTLSGGSLIAASTGAFGDGNVTVLSSAVSLTIQTGVLDAIADNGILSLAGGGTLGTPDFGFLNIASGLTETVSSLILAGVVQAPGTYGATGSGAQFINDEFFSGAGKVEVLVPEPSAGVAILAGLGVLVGVRRRRFLA